MTITERFLISLFGEELDELDRILLWTAPAKLSFYLRTPAEADRHVARIGQRQNIYFGCGLAPRNMSLHERAKHHEIRGIPGVWADIDVQNPKAHNKAKLPPTLDDALALASSLPLLPTLIVHSGHGIQPWWLFKEPWIFRGDDGGGAERAKAADAVEGWQAMLKANAAARGWEHDATHDLTRVMRLPGTYNIKDPDDIRPVTVAEWNDVRRYNPDDFEGYLLAGGAFEAWDAGKDMPPPVFSPRRGAALPPHFVTLMEDTPRLAATWQRKRRDMKDTSHSGWDMSLAGQLAGFGELFSDQDIADVITAHRERFCPEGSKEWKKAHDKDYLGRTIRRARIQRKEEVRQDALFETFDQGVPIQEVTADAEMVADLTGEHQEETEVTEKVRSGKPDLTHIDKAKKLAALSAVLKVKIIAVRRYLSEPPQFEISMPQGAVRVGDIGKLIGQTELRKVLAAAAGVVIPSWKPARWLRVCQAMLDCIDNVEVGDEGTEDGVCRAWLAQYLDENRPSKDADGACRNRRPFVAESPEGVEQTYIFLEGLREWLLARQERHERHELAVMLRRYGCTPVRYKLRRGDDAEKKETTRNVYLLP